jgi:hypothetical protein
VITNQTRSSLGIETFTAEIQSGSWCCGGWNVPPWVGTGREEILVVGQRNSWESHASLEMPTGRARVAGPAPEVFRSSYHPLAQRFPKLCLHRGTAPSWNTIWFNIIFLTIGHAMTWGRALWKKPWIEKGAVSQKKFEKHCPNGYDRVTRPAARLVSGTA